MKDPFSRTKNYSVKKCLNCEHDFEPTSGSQLFCDDYCAEDYRTHNSISHEPKLCACGRKYVQQHCQQDCCGVCRELGNRSQSVRDDSFERTCQAIRLGGFLSGVGNLIYSHPYMVDVGNSNHEWIAAMETVLNEYIEKVKVVGIIEIYDKKYSYTAVPEFTAAKEVQMGMFD